MDPVGIEILPETTDFIEALDNGEISMPADWTSEMTTAIVSAYQSAIDSLPETEDVDTEFNISDIDTDDQKRAVGELGSAVEGSKLVLKDYSDSLEDVSDQDIESNNKTSGIDKVSSSAKQAQKSVENTSNSVEQLSGIGVNVSNKVSPLNTMSGVTQNVASVFYRLLDLLRAWNNTTLKTQVLTVQTNYVKHAKGTKNAKAGMALLGDEYSPSGRPKPELVVSEGEAYIAGMDGPTFANLKSGDVVYPYDETKKILSRSSTAKFPAFAGGSIDYERLYKSVMDRTGGGGGTANYTDNSTNYNTYNYNAGSDSKSSDTEEEFDWVDWIEVILDRAERAVSDFKKSAESTYNSLKKRLKSTGSEIKAITNEIGLQEQAYQRYMQQANAVGLSSDLAQLVRDGTIDIRQYDEATRELISDYQNWYDKCLNCADAIVELHDNLAALYEDNFSNIQNDYEKQLERLSFLTNEYNNETQVINRNRTKTISTLRNELKDLEKAFSDAMASREIEEYSESWYGMANTIHDVRNQISEAYADIFSNIESKYDNQLQSLEHFTNEYNNAMEQISARGLMESKRFYSALSDIENKNITLMTNKLKEMEDALKDAVKNGEIEAYSTSWYDMRMAIDEVKESISDANLKLLEYNKSMRDIDWSYFDYARDRVSKLNEEAEFLIDLMSNDNLYQDNGQFNDKGSATLGLRVQNYDVDMAQADAYGEEIKKVNRDIAKDPYNTELIERREELLKLQRDSISAAESEKQAIKSLVEEGIKIELDNLKELIDSYNESLDSAKDLYDYQKKISDQTKNIASLEKQLAAYKNDTSEETRSRVQKISVDLDEARRQLEETQYDKYVSDSKKMLDNLYDEYSDLLNSRLDNVDELVSDMIDTVNDNSYDIKSTLNDVSDEVGYTITSEMQTIWNGTKDVATYYGEHFDEHFTNINTTLGNIRAFVELLAKNSDKEASGAISSTSSDTSFTNKDTTESTKQRTMTSTPKASSSSSSAGSAQLSLNRNLSYGSKGDDVKQLQQKLYDLGYLNAAPDGIFGEYTRAAVNAFQIANGLGVDGVVGPHTLAKLNGTPVLKRNAAATSVTYSRNLSYGSSGSDVVKLQKRLAELGYYSGAIDGSFGSMTLQAVKDFQSASGIYVDGVVGPVTIKSLNSKSKLGKYMKYATGGLVTRTGLAQLDGTPQKPELVLNARDTENFIALKEALSDLASPLRLASSSTFASALFGGGVNSGTNAVFNGGINIAIDHVENYDDLVRQIQKDGQFEKMILSMTVDRLAGRSQLEKHKFYK
jgi:peptidoglycan hydrolase-like protein with peptidoglycan-binding domain